MDKKKANFSKIKLLFCIAKPLPNAFPPMVQAAIKAVINRLVNNMFQWNVATKIVTIVTPVAPLIMPQISPMTSLQKLDTLLAFLIRRIARRAPFFFSMLEHEIL